MIVTLGDLGFGVVCPSLHLADAEKRAETADIYVASLDVSLGRGNTSAPVAKILRERGIPFVSNTAYDADQVSFKESTDRVVKKADLRVRIADDSAQGLVLGRVAGFRRVPTIQQHFGSHGERGPSLWQPHPGRSVAGYTMGAA